MERSSSENISTNPTCLMPPFTSPTSRRPCMLPRFLNVMDTVVPHQTLFALQVNPSSSCPECWLLKCSKTPSDPEDCLRPDGSSSPRSQTYPVTPRAACSSDCHGHTSDLPPCLQRGQLGIIRAPEQPCDRLRLVSLTTHFRALHPTQAFPSSESLHLPPPQSVTSPLYPVDSWAGANETPNTPTSLHTAAVGRLQAVPPLLPWLVPHSLTCFLGLWSPFLPFADVHRAWELLAVMPGGVGSLFETVRILPLLQCWQQGTSCLDQKHAPDPKCFSKWDPRSPLQENLPGKRNEPPSPEKALGPRG